MRKSAIAIGIIAGLAGRPAFSSALGTLANAMNKGEWKEFSTLNLDGELLFQNVNGDFWYADMATTWSNYPCWNPGTREMYWLGAPHMGPYAFLRYAETSNAWTSDTNVPDCMRLPNYEGCFNHGYDAGTIDPENGILYYHAETAFFAYAVCTKSWNQWSQPGYSGTRSDGMAFFPPLRKLVHVIGGTIRMINPETKTSETVAAGLEMGAYDNSIEYSPAHRKVFFGGGPRVPRFFIPWTAQKNITRLADAPEPFDCTHSSLACDPVTGNPLLLSNANKYYVYEPASNRWDNIANPPVALNIPESGTRYGQLAWNGKNHLGQPLAAGTYFLRWISEQGKTKQAKTLIAE